MMQDSPFRVIKVAFLVCLVCSVAVSLPAVLLKERQDFNKKIDRQKNILFAAGLLSTEDSVRPEDVQKIYGKIVTTYVDTVTGQEISMEEIASQGMGERITLSPEEGSGQQRTFYRKLLLYKVVEQQKVTAYIIPIEGKGLWSTMMGYIALSSDLQSVKGITFYQHGETPGLGGEIDNLKWKLQWGGKKIYDEQGQVRLSVEKGGDAKGEFGVDGLSGATITSNGVDFMVKFWLGDRAYGRYLRNQVLGNAPSL